MRVLLLADQCNPEWPSLPVVGYKAAKAIADVAEVTVVTQIRNKENIDKHGFGAAKVDYVDTEYIAAPIYRFLKWLRGKEGSWTTVMAFNYPNYLAFEYEVWKKYGAAIKAGEFDVVHRVTPMSPTLPSYLAGKCPVPFILGPLNGGLPWPKAYREELRNEKEWLAAVRNAYKILPYSRSTYRESSAILTSFEHTLQQIPENLRHKTIDFPEVGIDPELFEFTPRAEAVARRRILFAGRLVPYKQPELVVDAFVASKALQQHELWIVGDGPLRASMEAKVKQAGLEEQVRFLGWKTQAEVGDIMADCDIFAFPSVRELGAGVVVEAMACGLVCAVFDYGAPGVLVDDQSGVRVPLLSRSQNVTAFTQALEDLVERDELDVMRKAAFERATQLFSWSSKATKTIEVYRWALGQRTKPDFWSVE